MILAGKSANEKGIPVVLDAVGVGATHLRNTEAERILNQVNIAVIKGNQSEIAKIAGMEATTKGVEATKIDTDLVALAKNLATTKKTTVVITGKEDIVASSTSTYLIKNGHEMMGAVVGTGCMAASVLGAFVAIEKDHAKACAAALACYGIAGEIASKTAKGPGTFKEQFYDAVYQLSESQVKEGMKVEQL